MPTDPTAPLVGVIMGSRSDWDAMRAAAEAKGVVNMVNFTYRNSPALQKARELVMALTVELRNASPVAMSFCSLEKSQGSADPPPPRPCMSLH